MRRVQLSVTKPDGLRFLLSALLLGASVLSVGLPPAQAETLARPDVAAQVQATSAAVEDSDAQLRATQEAYNLLLDNFVHPLDPADLARAGWDQLVRDAADRKAPTPGPLPALADDRAADWETLRAALAAYLARPTPTPDGFVAAHSVIRGMVHFVDEGHTYFLDPQQYHDYQAWSRGENRYVGIGISLNTREAEPRVVEVYEDTPAERAGLLPGDVIVQINDKPAAGLTLDELTAMIRGPAGTTVQLGVRRGDAPDVLVLTAQRAEIHLDFVKQRVLADDIGYILLRGFPEPSVADTIEHDVATFQQQGVHGLVIDLRGNSGGRLDVGTRLLSHFLPGGTTVYEEVDRSGRDRLRVARTGLDQYDLPLVVLVDGGTASMGEIFASAMQQHGTATVLGSPTAGSVAAAQVFGLPDGSGLQVTVFEIRAADGQQLNRVGVMPDEVIEPDPSDYASGDDPVLDRAIEILHAGNGGGGTSNLRGLSLVAEVG